MEEGRRELFLSGLQRNYRGEGSLGEARREDVPVEILHVTGRCTIAIFWLLLSSLIVRIKIKYSTIDD